MGYDTIHETAIKDILDMISDAKDSIGTLAPKNSGVAYSGSLTKATKGLIMEFPVLVSKANHIESAGIVAKAYEAKFVTMLQMAFAAFNITNITDGKKYIEHFHTNLDFGKISVDDFIDFMEEQAAINHENGMMTADTYAQFRAVTNDMKSLSYYFDEDINESSLDSFKFCL